MQPERQKVPKDVTEEGMVMEVKLVHFKKQEPSIDLMLEGIVMEVKLLQIQYLLLVDYQCYTL